MSEAFSVRTDSRSRSTSSDPAIMLVEAQQDLTDYLSETEFGIIMHWSALPTPKSNDYDRNLNIFFKPSCLVLQQHPKNWRKIRSS